MSALHPWIQNVALHPDVISDTFSEDIFALDLGPLADYLRGVDMKLPKKDLPVVPAVYRDAEQFFRASYLTTGLRGLLADVLDRLGGGAGNRVLKLVTAFGGGKSHTLAALLHAARDRKALDLIPEGKGLPKPGKVRIAVFDGQFFDATSGKQAPGGDFRIRTMWGWIAWSLGGIEGYDLVRKQDEARVAPGGDEILPLLKEGSNLILLDEVLEYLISAGGVKVEKTTLRDETVSFLKRLPAVIGNSSSSALVFSLQSSKRESLEYHNLRETVEHFAGRKDQAREPVEGDEIMRVVQRRLLAELPGEAAAAPAAQAYQQIFAQMRRAYARSPAEEHQADDDALALRDRIQAAYPFHPGLMDVMRERWAAIPDFQRTRGALRFLAACLRTAHREGRSRAVLGAGDVPIQDSEVRLAFFKEVGQREDFQACLEHDFIGANARTRKIDEKRAREVPGESGKRPATRLATAILMYSFGGRRRDAASQTELLPPGITEPDLLAMSVCPDLDSTTAQACLKELKEQCLYLHFDGVVYCFKKDPNITLLVEQESDAVARDETRVRAKIKEMIEERLAGHRTAIVWPTTRSTDLSDHEAEFLIGYMPLEFGTKSDAAAEALEYFEKCGGSKRDYRNGIALAVPSDDQIETLRRAVRYLLAIEQVRTKAKQHNLTDAQKSQLKEREATEGAAAESALLKLYTEVWFPRLDGSGLAIDKVSAGGRPLQTTLDEKKHARIHDRVMELITSVQPKVFGELKPSKIVDLFKLGVGDPPKLGIRTSDVVSGFYSFLGYTRLKSESVIRRAVAEGIKKRLFAYTTGSPKLGDGKYQIDISKLAWDATIPDDEIDLQAGFLIEPSAIMETPATETGDGAFVTPPGEDAGATAVSGAEATAAAGASVGTVVTTVATTAGAKKSGPPPVRNVNFSFSANRNELFTAWNALANLADLAGAVQVTVSATSDVGIDQAKLENAVLEPLREVKLID